MNWVKNVSLFRAPTHEVDRLHPMLAKLGSGHHEGCPSPELWCAYLIILDYPLYETPVWSSVTSTDGNEKDEGSDL